MRRCLRARRLPALGGGAWVYIEGGQDKDAVSLAVLIAVGSRLGLL